MSFLTTRMKDAIYLVLIIVIGITQVPTEVLATSPPRSSTQDNIPAMPPAPSMREGTRATPP